MTSSPTRADRRSRLRQLPVPACEPPFDDEVGGWRPPAPPASAAAAIQGTLALSFMLPSGVPSTPEAPPDLRLVPPSADLARHADDFGPQPTARTELPDPRLWSGRFVQAVVEVIAGDRPLAQLLRWTTADVYDDVSRRMVRGRHASTRAMVRSVHVSEPVNGVAEVAAMVRHGERAAAVAVRLEGLDGRWQCTAMVLGWPLAS